MYGAIIGDIVGSKYEFNDIKTKSFDLFSAGCNYTDDSLMTIAVAEALTISREKQLDFKTILVEQMQEIGRKYPCPMGGYGGRFAGWLRSKTPMPYNSFGNGSAMRVSPCGLIAVELAEALSLAKASAEVTHNHPEGIKGAQAIAGAVFLAKCGKSKDEIKKFIETNFYDLDKSLDEIRPTYYFNETCQGTVPQAIQAFLESESFEDAIRNAVSLGGDCDTLTAITGSIAWAFYVPYWRTTADLEHWKGSERDIFNEACSYLPQELIDSCNKFMSACVSRLGTYGRTGFCSAIPHTEDKSEFLKFTLEPPADSIDGELLKEQFSKTSKKALAKEFAEGEHHVAILDRYKLGVRNYGQYVTLINKISSNHEYLNTATLEECLLYLTYLWRADYFAGGYSDFDINHRHELRLARMRILDILFDEKIMD